MIFLLLFCDCLASSVLLRRRISLKAQADPSSPASACAAQLESAWVSKLADPCVALLVRPVQRLTKGIETHWLDDKKVSTPSPLCSSTPSSIIITIIVVTTNITTISQVDVCASTGTPFSLFTRRHHCRVSGRIYIDGASDC